MRLERGRTGFNYALLSYVVLVIFVITVAPFEFHIPNEVTIRFTSSLSNLLSNILLFIPAGFIFQMARKTVRGEFLLGSLLFGLVLSACVEILQVFVVGRITSVVDLAANGLGAWIGGFLLYLMVTKVKEPADRVFFLDLPLMNLLYLLVPLLWVNGFAIGSEQLRLALTTLLGLFGCGVLVSIYVNRLREHPGFSPVRLGVAAFVWFLVATLPAIRAYPLLVPGIGFVLGVVTAMAAVTGVGTYAKDRRFELPTLQVLVPFLMTYILLLTGWPPASAVNLRGEVVRITGGRLVEVFQLVEVLAAFTLLGYIIAEMRGRRDESALKTCVWILLVIALFISWAIVVQVLWLGGTASIQLVTLPLLGGLFGGMIYRLQLAALQRRLQTAALQASVQA
ncbi:MAG: VanZ family protein [Acidobacteriota bacterium]|nr:MAG: VanZ family protein [Acidobacteriota bacterium]